MSWARKVWHSGVTAAAPTLVGGKKPGMPGLGPVELWLRRGDSWGQHLVPDSVLDVRETVPLCSPELSGSL